MGSGGETIIGGNDALVLWANNLLLIRRVIIIVSFHKMFWDRYQELINPFSSTGGDKVANSR